MRTIRGAKPVIVGIDGSDASLAALDWAVEEAESRSLGLEIVHCLPWAQPSALHPEPVAPVKLRSASVLEEALTRCRLTAPELPVTTTLTVASPTGTLIERSCDAELVVLGAVGQRRRPGDGLGSVADVVASYAQCPVIVVRGEQLSEAGTRGPVVVGLDAASDCTELLGFAFDEASRRGTGLLAVHGWTYRQVVEWHEPASWWAPGETARHALDATLTGWRDKFPEVDVTERTIHAEPARALVAESLCCQLVVVSARGYRDMAGAVLGPVSQEVVTSAACPVAVVVRGHALATDPRGGLRPVHV
jgi:nucleotide-binding universal stress UspA family protein